MDDLMARYRKRLPEVVAAQWLGYGVMALDEALGHPGVYQVGLYPNRVYVDGQSAEPSDWITIGPKGKVRVLSDYDFTQTFEAVD